MLLLVDNGSIYTKNLAEFLAEKKINFETKTPDLLDLGSLSNYDAIILSGRRKNEQKTNQVNSKVIKYSIQNNKKLLGICYGAEILALTLGGTIRKIDTLQKGHEEIEMLQENMLCHNKIKVFESHSYEISKLPATLSCMGKSKNCKYEIIQYSDKPIFGTQFHPELTKDGNDLIEKFCSL